MLPTLQQRQQLLILCTCSCTQGTTSFHTHPEQFMSAGSLRVWSEALLQCYCSRSPLHLGVGRMQQLTHSRLEGWSPSIFLLPHPMQQLHRATELRTLHISRRSTASARGGSILVPLVLGFQRVARTFGQAITEHVELGLQVTQRRDEVIDTGNAPQPRAPLRGRVSQRSLLRRNLLHKLLRLRGRGSQRRSRRLRLQLLAPRTVNPDAPERKSLNPPRSYWR